MNENPVQWITGRDRRGGIIISMYGDSEYSNQKNNLYDEIKWFLEDHPISELIAIVADVIEREKEE